MHGDAIKAMMPKDFKESIAVGVKINWPDFFFFFNEKVDQYSLGKNQLRKVRGNNASITFKFSGFSVC